MYSFFAHRYLLQIDGTTVEGKAKIAQWTAILTSLLLIGWAIGGLLFGILTDKLGRARSMFLTIATYSVATALCAASFSIWWLLVFRFISSLGIGGEWAAGASLVCANFRCQNLARSYLTIFMFL
jgi:MFS family permease